jgi:uncharacterized protein (DUF2236 family)
MTRHEGYFPPGSVLRRVQSERAVGLLYGQRALMLGALQPLAFIGTTQRSKAHKTPWRRLTHTAQMFEAVFFGSREQADRALAFTACTTGYAERSRRLPARSQRAPRTRLSIPS